MLGPQTPGPVRSAVAPLSATRQPWDHSQHGILAPRRRVQQPGQRPGAPARSLHTGAVRSDRRPRAPQDRAGAVRALEERRAALALRPRRDQHLGRPGRGVPRAAAPVARALLRPAGRCRGLAGLRLGDRHRRGRLHPAGGLRRPARGRPGRGAGPRDPGQSPLLPGGSARPVPADRHRPARGRAAPPGERITLVARGDREALRPRPRLRARAQPPGGECARRAPDVPHRPLPGQGDRPEHPGVPLRQLDLRAALEPQVRRPRADHDGRGDRRRAARQVLRRDGRRARRDAEPPAAGDWRSWRWSCRRLSRPTTCATRS